MHMRPSRILFDCRSKSLKTMGLSPHVEDAPHSRPDPDPVPEREGPALAESAPRPAQPSAPSPLNPPQLP